MIKLVLAVFLFNCLPLLGISQASYAQQADPNAVVCEETSPSILGGIFGTIVSAGEFILVTLPVTTGTVVVGVVKEVPSIAVDATLSLAEFGYSAVFICTWWGGTPHPDVIFRPQSKAPQTAQR